MMSQHINAIMEHLLLRKNKNPESSPKDESVANAKSDKEKDPKYIDTVDNAKSKSIFKNFIPSTNENGTSTNIFQNFIKNSESNHENVPSISSEKNVDSLNNNPPITAIVQPVVSPPMYEYKKRNSVVSSLQPNGDTKQRELAPTPRTSHRKSSHDIRFRANQSLLEGDDVGKMAVVKPIKTKNIITKRETFDTLHHRAVEVSENYLIIPAITCMNLES